MKYYSIIRGYAQDYCWNDHELHFASIGLPLSGSSHLISRHSRWLNSLFLLPFGRRTRSSDYRRNESQGLSSGDPVSCRLSTPRLSATFFQRGWHEQTDQTDHTGNSWILARKKAGLETRINLRDRFFIFFNLFEESCSLVNKCNDNNYVWDTLKNKNI